ncbi:HD domain-containing protein [Chromobacterium vaccinii]|uniref:HD domain-containing protein n=1 Tax=Chromobacterium vaccinii TaxID=1108595 RepID=A0ABV0FAG1_9NEIS
MQAYWRYWGKSSPRDEAGDRWHLLPFHMLDVAAVMAALLDQRPAWGQVCAGSLGWDVAQLRAAAVYFALLHDPRKLVRSFQSILLKIGRFSGGVFVLQNQLLAIGLFPTCVGMNRSPASH